MIAGRRSQNFILQSATLFSAASSMAAIAHWSALQKHSLQSAHLNLSRESRLSEVWKPSSRRSESKNNFKVCARFVLIIIQSRLTGNNEVFIFRISMQRVYLQELKVKLLDSWVMISIIPARGSSWIEPTNVIGYTLFVKLFQSPIQCVDSVIAELYKHQILSVGLFMQEKLVHFLIFVFPYYLNKAFF